MARLEIGVRDDKLSRSNVSSACLVDGDGNPHASKSAGPGRIRQAARETGKTG